MIPSEDLDSDDDPDDHDDHDDHHEYFYPKIFYFFIRPEKLFDPKKNLCPLKDRETSWKSENGQRG